MLNSTEPVARSNLQHAEMPRVVLELQFGRIKVDGLKSSFLEMEGYVIMLGSQMSV
jgi:hypothetical protein